jgi:hypothetical protein
MGSKNGHVVLWLAVKIHLSGWAWFQTAHFRM